MSSDYEGGGEAAPGDGAQRWVLRLYVTGGTRSSAGAIRNIRKLCDEHLAGRCDLTIVDVYQQPALARDAQLVATPTLVRELPTPIRRFIGTLSDVGVLLAGLDVEPAEKEGA